MDHYQNSFISDISKNRLAIMGFALLSIMFFHQNFTSVFPFNIFHSFGFWGVDVFLFLSGMGLVNSLEKYSTATFYKRRFNRLVPSLILCGTAKLALFLLLDQSVSNISEVFNMSIWSLVCLYSSWFVYTIIILYISAPALFFLLKRCPHITILGILFIFFFSDIILKPIAGNSWMSAIGISVWTIERLPVFTFGMFIAIKQCNINRSSPISNIFLVIAIFLTITAKYGVIFTTQQSLTFLSLTLGVPSLINIVLLIIEKTPTLLLKPFIFLGCYSFEIYLFDGFYFRDLKINHEEICPFLLLPFSFILTCFSAYFCKILISKYYKLKLYDNNGIN